MKMPNIQVYPNLVYYLLYLKKNSTLYKLILEFFFLNIYIYRIFSLWSLIKYKKLFRRAMGSSSFCLPHTLLRVVGESVSLNLAWGRGWDGVATALLTPALPLYFSIFSLSPHSEFTVTLGISLSRLSLSHLSLVSLSLSLSLCLSLHVLSLSQISQSHFSRSPPST